MVEEGITAYPQAERFHVAVLAQEDSCPHVLIESSDVATLAAISACNAEAAPTARTAGIGDR